VKDRPVYVVRQFCGRSIRADPPFIAGNASDSLAYLRLLQVDESETHR
jgi:hypothetical protein